MISTISDDDVYDSGDGMYIGVYYPKGEGEIGGNYRLGAGVQVSNVGINNDVVTNDFGNVSLYGEAINLNSVGGFINLNGLTSTLGDLVVNGQVSADNIDISGTKSRVVETSDGTLSLHAYETPTPYFGDIGASTLNDQGLDTIPIDYLFSNTINTNVEYAVFLQKEGQGDLWVKEKDPLYFTVQGTPGLKYSWELKAVQRDYECVDLEEHSSQLRVNVDDKSDDEVSDILDGIISSLDKEELFKYESN